MKIWQKSLLIASAVTVMGAAVSLALPEHDTVNVTARVLDLSYTGDRRVVIAMHKLPFVLQYGAHSHGTTEFCVMSEVTQTPRTCYRAKGFDASSSDAQHLKFVWMDPSIYEN